MRALSRTVVDVIWAAVGPLLARRPGSHPLGCHRRRVCDRLCLRGIIIRLVTGCSWQSVEFLLDNAVSDTTLRSRRDEWEQAGVSEMIAAEAIAAYDRIMGLKLPDVCIDGSIHKAPCGGPGTGESPVDRRKLGWKASIATEGAGIPVGWAADGANRNDVMLLGPTVDQVVRRGLHHDIDTPAQPAPLGLRWTVERTNSWLSNHGQIRRNTDRKPQHRLAQLALAVALIIVIKLIDHRDRWQPPPAPIR